MKEFFKRSAVVLLVLTMLLSSVPVGLAAKERPSLTEPETTAPPQELPEVGSTTTHVRIDPMYEGIIDPESVHIPEPIRFSDENDLGLAANSGIEYAADAFRKAAIARQKYLNVYLTMDTYDGSEAWNAVYYAGVAHSGIPTEGDYIRYNILSAAGNATYMGYDGGYVFFLSYEFTYTDTAAQEAIMDDAVDDLLDELDLWDASDYDKVRGVYDYICDNVTYDHEHLDYGAGYPLMFSAYAALVNKTAVCQGYATLFYRLMLELNVDARVIAGDGGGPHAWNIVEIAGHYYNLDSTWDAGMPYYSWFLRSESNFTDHIREDEFTTTAFRGEYPTSSWDYAAWLDPADGVLETGSCGNGVEWMMTTDNILYIYGEGAIPDYSLLGAPWYKYGYRVRKIALDDDITRIGDYSFVFFDALYGQYLPDGIESIGEGAFYFNGNIRFIGLPGGLKTLGADAFAFCFALEEVLFYSPAPTIGTDAFCGVDAIAAFYDDGSWTSANRLDYGGSLTWQYFPGYRVTFQNWNGRMIYTDFYDYGETIYVPADPERPDDSTYTYTFAGWSPAVNEICTGEATYTATFRAIKRGETPGDTTGDGVLNNDDVVFLLWYTLFPGDYTVSCAADFNCDGSVTNDDVIYLLWHTLFGDQYPIH